MRLKLYVAGVFLLFLENVASSPLNTSNLNYEINKKNLHDYVAFLTADALEGRLTGTMGEKLAAQYIATQFLKLGLEPAGDNGTFFQEFNFTSGISPIREKKHHLKRGHNVLARLRLGNQAQPLIVIGAHLDHLGHGTLSGSRQRENEKNRIHPGADDNASGVASILEIAAKLHSLKIQNKLQGNKDILFAAWSGEEYGILGSSHFVTNLIKRSAKKSLRSQIDAAINLDMVGHLRKSLVIQGVGSSAEWSQFITEIKQHHAMPILIQNDPYLPTDSTSFYIRGIPTLNFFTGAHDEYHTPRDTAETLNYEGIKSISEFLVDLILTIENKNHVISYKAVHQSSEKPKREFKLYLGTIPDYAGSDVSGVRLSGIAKNSPAEEAGLQSNDVIIKLAGKNIHDIYDYTSVLNSLYVGKPVSLIILRKQKKIALKIAARYK